jgi:hypothetical protein
MYSITGLSGWRMIRCAIVRLSYFWSRASYGAAGVKGNGLLPCSVACTETRSLIPFVCDVGHSTRLRDGVSLQRHLQTRALEQGLAFFGEHHGT